MFTPSPHCFPDATPPSQATAMVIAPACRLDASPKTSAPGRKWANVGTSGPCPQSSRTACGVAPRSHTKITGPHRAAAAAHGIIVFAEKSSSTTTHVEHHEKVGHFGAELPAHTESANGYRRRRRPRCGPVSVLLPLLRVRRPESGVRREAASGLHARAHRPTRPNSRLRAAHNHRPVAR